MKLSLCRRECPHRPNQLSISRNCRYITDFGEKKDDIGLAAEVDKKVVGAVWVRIMDDYGHIDNGTLSFAISLYKDYRGFGIVDENGEEYIMLCRL